MTERFDSLARPIIDGRPTGFCKLVADREHHTFPTYANGLGRAALRAAGHLDSRSGWADEGTAWDTGVAAALDD